MPISSRPTACASGATSIRSCECPDRRAGWKENEIPATYDAIHKALLTGLLGNLGCRSEDSMFSSARMASSSSSIPRRAAAKKAALADGERNHRDEQAVRRCIARVDPLWLAGKWALT